MKLLINACYDKFLFIIINNDFSILDWHEVLTKNNLTDLMVELIYSKLKLLNKSLTDIQEVYLVDGPGSFTGIRVSSVLAKTICITNKATLFSCSSNFFQAKNSKRFISVMDARSNKRYFMIKNLLFCSKIKDITNQKLLKVIKKKKNHTFYNYYDINYIKDNIQEILTNKFLKVNNILNFKPRYIKNYI